MSEMPEPGQNLHIRGRSGHLQNLVHLWKRTSTATGMVMNPSSGGISFTSAHVRGQQRGILSGLEVIAIHGGTHSNEVQVMAVVHHRIQALRPLALM